MVIPKRAGEFGMKIVDRIQKQPKYCDFCAKKEKNSSNICIFQRKSVLLQRIKNI